MGVAGRARPGDGRVEWGALVGSSFLDLPGPVGKARGRPVVRPGREAQMDPTAAAAARRRPPRCRGRTHGDRGGRTFPVRHHARLSALVPLARRISRAGSLLVIPLPTLVQAC